MFFQTEDIFSCSKNASYYCRCTYLIELLSEQMVLLYFIAEWVRDKWALLLFCCIIVSNPAAFFGTRFSTIVISPWDCISALFWFVNTSSLVPTVWFARSVLQSDWSHLISRNFGVLYLPRCYISSSCFFHKDGDILCPDVELVFVLPMNRIVVYRELQASPKQSPQIVSSGKKPSMKHIKKKVKRKLTLTNSITLLIFTYCVYYPQDTLSGFSKRWAVAGSWTQDTSGALPLSHNSRTTANFQNPLYILHRCSTMAIVCPKA